MNQPRYQPFNFKAGAPASVAAANTDPATEDKGVVCIIGESTLEERTRAADLIMTTSTIVEFPPLRADLQEALLEQLSTRNVNVNLDLMRTDKKVYVGESGIQREIWSVEISDDTKPLHSPTTIYVTVEDGLDRVCKKLSAMMPQATLQLKRAARIKAIYQKGVRIRSWNYEDFFVNLTLADIKSLLVYDDDIHDHF